MSSCCKAPSSPESLPEKPSSSRSSRWTNIAQLLDWIHLPSALLHSSCCWLPAVLDLFALGSASATLFHRLQPIFLAITLILLAEKFYRQGITLQNLLRLVLSASILVLPRLFDSVMYITRVSGVRSKASPSILTGITQLVLIRSKFQNRVTPALRSRIGFTSSPVITKNGLETPCSSRKAPPPSASFWRSYTVWKRASINTLRCLIGCTLGDFGMLWYLRSNFPSLDMPVTMGLSMAAGLTTSLTLETILLKMGPDQLDWGRAAKTAASMSFVSMMAMETTQNLVDIYITGGVVSFTEIRFWLAAGASMGAGFLVPLPYNYFQLRKYGRACH